MDFTDEEFEKIVFGWRLVSFLKAAKLEGLHLVMMNFQNVAIKKQFTDYAPITDDLPPEVLLQFMFYASSVGLICKITGQSTIAHFPAERLRFLKYLSHQKKAKMNFQSFRRWKNHFQRRAAFPETKKLKWLY
jgi:hypothetical protein